MRSFLRVLAAFLLLCALYAPGVGEEMAFGGRGEDALYAAAACEDGFFAVGKTASTDGDLASRKRTGETGWALRVGRDGQKLWDFCSAKSGMYEMIAPHAYADGRFALVLTDETRQRGEWIVLSERGRQESRVAIPQTGRILQMVPTVCSAGPCLLLLAEQDAMISASALTQDGGSFSCGTFFADAQGVLRAAPQGGAMYLCADLGALSIIALAPGSAPQMKTVALSDGNTAISGVTDALVGSDGSVLVLAKTVVLNKEGGTMLLRVSAEGEVLFAHAFEAGERVSQPTETDAGYAVICEDAVLYFDEDGAMLGRTRIVGEALDLFPAEGGVYMLTHDPERGHRQAVFTLLAMEEPAQQEEKRDMPVPEEALTQPTDSGEGDRLTLLQGYLRCKDDGLRGVTVARVDGEGNTLWQTRTPIHTAADRLVWETAQIIENGDILLSGFYETQTAQGAQREGAQAVLSSDGVLREIGLTE